MKKFVNLIAVMAAALVGAFVANYAINAFSRAAITMADVERTVKAGAPQMFGVIEARFPDDYRALLDELFAIAKTQSSNQQIAAASSAATVRLRKKYAGVVGQSSDAALKRAVEANKDLLDAVYAKDGAELCGSFALSGPSVLLADNRIEAFMASIDAAGARFFEAAAEARDRPVSRGAATDADWGAVADTFDAAGAKASWGELLANNVSNDAEYCPALSAFLDAVIATPGEAGERVRGTYVADSASM